MTERTQNKQNLLESVPISGKNVDANVGFVCIDEAKDCKCCDETLFVQS